MPESLIIESVAENQRLNEDDGSGHGNDNGNVAEQGRSFVVPYLYRAVGSTFLRVRPRSINFASVDMTWVVKKGLVGCSCLFLICAGST